MNIETVKNRVDNPYDLKHWYPSDSRSNLDSYDLLILTSEDFKEAFTPLKEAHELKGIRTQIKTLQDISAIPGIITHETIRTFLRDEYYNYNINYVLLGGDIDIIPAPMLYVYGLDEEKWPYETILPADFYYGCIDGPFNFDDDELWGEPTDGEEGGDVDLFSELAIGRAPVDSISDINRFVFKTISYITMDQNDPYLSEILMLGEYLGDHGIASWGGNYLDLLINESIADGYYTKGIPSDHFVIDTLYDRDHPDNYWSSEELINKINNNNVHILNHDGHASYGYNMRMVNDQVNYFENSKYFFDYSVGCMSGGFDQDDCFAEYLTVKTNNGAFSAIMNARYGWFWSHSTDGDGTRFAREYWDAVFGEKIPSIGKANHDSKEDNIYLLDRSCMRWTYYGLNLFGDPAVTFHISKPPENPEIQGPDSGKINEEYIYEISTIEPDNEDIQYYIEFEETNGYWTEEYYEPEEIVNFNYTWTAKGTYSIRVKARDIHGIESDWSNFEVSIAKSRKIILFDCFNFIQRIIELLDVDGFLHQMIKLLYN